MEIKLYKLHINKKEKNLTPLTLIIEGRQITHIYIPENKPNNGYSETKFYTYERDNKYKHQYKKLKLNYRFSIEGDDEFDDDDIANFEGYTHLGLIQSLRLKWFHNKTWLQQPENIKWLISIPISIATACITTYITSKHTK